MRHSPLSLGVIMQYIESHSTDSGWNLALDEFVFSHMDPVISGVFASRLKCVFEPSCSEYMILAVNKYGLVRGVIKGIRRLLRCHPPNGGKDYP